MLLATRAGVVGLPVLYACVFLISCSGAFENPARAALLPSMVPREDFPRAVTIASTNQALAFASGPAVGGLVISMAGIATAYASYLVLVGLAFFGIASLRAGARPVLRFERHLAQPVETTWRAVTDPDEMRAWLPTRIEIAEWKGGHRGLETALWAAAMS